MAGRAQSSFRTHCDRPHEATRPVASPSTGRMARCEQPPSCTHSRGGQDDPSHPWAESSSHRPTTTLSSRPRGARQSRPRCPGATRRPAHSPPPCRSKPASTGRRDWSGCRSSAPPQQTCVGSCSPRKKGPPHRVAGREASRAPAGAIPAMPSGVPRERCPSQRLCPASARERFRSAARAAARCWPCQATTRLSPRCGGWFASTVGDPHSRRTPARGITKR